MAGRSFACLASCQCARRDPPRGAAACPSVALARGRFLGRGLLNALVLVPLVLPPVFESRLELLASVLSAWSGEEVPRPDGAFYLWIPVADGWEYTERLAREGGALVSPGEFYGVDGTSFVRAAVVQPDERIQLVADRLAAG